jgi:hypothetical protein
MVIKRWKYRMVHMFYFYVASLIPCFPIWLAAPSTHRLQ